MLYDILIDFPGSQDGSVTEQFVAGTQRELSDYLAPLAVSAGWARLVEPTPQATEPVATPDVEPAVTDDPEPAPEAPARRRGRH